LKNIWNKKKHHEEKKRKEKKKQKEKEKEKNKRDIKEIHFLPQRTGLEICHLDCRPMSLP
jgi:hypothetical protein